MYANNVKNSKTSKKTWGANKWVAKKKNWEPRQSTSKQRKKHWKMENEKQLLIVWAIIHALLRCSSGSVK